MTGPIALPWIGEFKSDWPVVPNKAIIKPKKESVGVKAHEYDLLSLTKQGVVIRNLDEGGKFPENFDSYQRVEPGNLVTCLFDVEETPRTIGISNHSGMITGAYDVFEFKGDVNPRFFEYYYLALDQRKGLKYFYSGLRNVIRTPVFLSIPMPMPPRAEQDAIVYYLDSEIIRLEEVISRLVKIIAVAKERKQSLIQKAISVGLRQADLVETNISWIPRIPANWRMIKLRYLVSSHIGLTYSPEEITLDETMPLVLRAGNVKNGKLDLSDELRVTTKIPRDIMLKEGDILVCARSGSKALVGKSALVEHLNKTATFGAFMTVLRSPLGKYLYWVMNSELLQYQMGRFDSVTINQLTNSTLLDFEIPVPDEESRLEISDYLDRETAIIDRQIELSEQLMSLTKARRESLISAAVTGNLDVGGTRNG